MIGRQLKADAVMVGTVAEYRGLAKLSTDGSAWIQAYLGEVTFSVDILDTRDESVLFHCQKAGSSLNFLETPIKIYGDQRSPHEYPRITQTLNTALHGTNAAEMTAYIAVILVKELAETLSSIRWESSPHVAGVERTRPGNDNTSAQKSRLAQGVDESKKEAARSDADRSQDAEQLRVGVVKITAKPPGGMVKAGTGFIVRLDKDAAYIITAAHVVAGDPQPKVEFFTKRNLPVPSEVLGIEGDDEVRGLALLVVRGPEHLPKGLKALPFDETVRFFGGEDVIMIGFPGNAGPWNVVKGNISSRQGRDLYFSPTVDSGHSGGPILQNGKVVGLVAAAGMASGRGLTARSVHDYVEGFGVTVENQVAPGSP
jgi:S1-C subfamily serine protease